MAVDLDDRVVDIDQHELVLAPAAGDQQRRPVAKPSQEPRGDRVELANVPEREARRHNPSVDGAYARSKTRPIPPCRNRAMSSMLSAPAIIPPTSDDTFSAAFAPLSLGTDTCSWANLRSPAASAKATTGTSPADDTRFGSSKTADVAGHV